MSSLVVTIASRVWDPDSSCIAASEVKVPLVRSSFSDRNHDGIADVLKLSVVWWPSENGVVKWCLRGEKMNKTK